MKCLVAAQLGNGSSDLLTEGGAEEIVEVEEASQAAWRRVSGGVWKRSRQRTCYLPVYSHWSECRLLLWYGTMDGSWSRSSRVGESWQKHCEVGRCSTAVHRESHGAIGLVGALFSDRLCIIDEKNAPPQKKIKKALKKRHINKNRL